MLYFSSRSGKVIKILPLKYNAKRFRSIKNGKLAKTVPLSKIKQVEDFEIKFSRYI